MCRPSHRVTVPDPKNIYIVPEDPGTMRKKTLVFIGSIVLTLAIFVFLFLRIDLEAFRENASRINVVWLFIAILMLIPPYLLFAYRWKILISDYRTISVAESFRLFLFSQSVSALTPSRLGDWGRAYFLRDKKFTLRIGTSVFIFERAMDLFFLLLYCVVGILITQGSSVQVLGIVVALATALFCILILALTLSFGEGSLTTKLLRRLIFWRRGADILIGMLSYFEVVRKDKLRLFTILMSSAALWFFLLLEGYLFFWAIGYQGTIGLVTALAILPLGILVGLIPITLVGMGTRDTAFIVLFRDYAPADVMVLFGLLFSLRYFVPALVGLIWTRRYVKSLW
jgi:glycosyltransferase 2 family protein